MNPRWGLALSQRGTSSLEFIIVFPFLLFIMLAGVELSRAWLTANVVQNAVREGARLGAVSPAASVSTDGSAKISAVLSGAKLTPTAGPTVTCDPSPCSSGTNSRVIASVTVQFQTVVPLFIPLLSAIDITQTATMRYE